MLIGLLPGLREIRAPLAAGFLWLLAGWLALRDAFPSREEATGVVDDLYSLSDVASVIGIGVAASFAAYLVGVLSQALLAGLARSTYNFLWLASPRVVHIVVPFMVARFVDPHHGDPASSTRSRRSLSLLVTRTLRSANEALSARELRLKDVLDHEVPLPQSGFLPSGWPEEIGKFTREQAEILEFENAPRSWQEMPEADYELVNDRLPRLRYAEDLLTDKVFAELPLAATRLIGVKNELFSTVDRLRGEAEFRTAIAPPLLAIGLVIATQTGFPGLILVSSGALAVAALVYAQGVESQRERNDLLADVLFLGEVKSPLLERIGEAIENALVSVPVDAIAPPPLEQTGPITPAAPRQADSAG